MSSRWLALSVVVILCMAAKATSPCLAATPEADRNAAAERITLVSPMEATFREALAAKEIRRYVYLCTGRLLPDAPAATLPAEGDAVVIASKNRRLIDTLGLGEEQRRRINGLQAQQYMLALIRREGRRVLLVAGGDDVGTLYGAYRLAELFGVRFFLHGDVIPDRQIPLELPEADETGKPLFALRGVNPWGSHPFGFDLWNTDDYKAHIGQLAKMRMNFIGMHCYGEGHPYAEPTVWVGLDGDFDEQGRVRFSYPSSYYNALFRTRWGRLRPGKTSEYHLGAAMLFERDDWGPDVMIGHTPRPATPEACNEVFNRTGAMFGEAFGLARRLGVKTCLGTETPMIMPAAVRQRLAARGKDPADPAAVREVYEGIFRRIMKTLPLDYYWLWTPEGWTWRGNTPEQLKATVDDVKIAREALDKVNAPFQLATCGWVLGPKGDRAILDRQLPSNIPLSSISRHLGEDPIDPAYGQVRRRDKWAIPWMEGDNGGLAVPQLWVGRTRQDAADALRYRCSGLMGLIWRTRILGPNISALARAGWEQPWSKLAAPAVNDAAADSAGPSAEASSPRLRKVPCEDFYADWAAALFGPAVADEVARIFARIDSRLPRPLSRGCPAGLRPDARAWEQVAPAYAFVDDLARCRHKVTGAGNRARFDYWLGTMQYLRAGARLDCAAGKFHRAMQTVTAEKNPARRKEIAAETALPAYREILSAYAEAFGYLLDTTGTSGALATVMFWEQSIYPAALGDTARELAQALGRPLPADAVLPKRFTGRPRIIVPTVRTSLARGEVLRLKVIILAADSPREASVKWREMGRGEFHKTPFTHVARGVYLVRFAPPAAASDIEYYVEAAMPDGRLLVFPPTAPRLNETLVLLPDQAE